MSTATIERPAAAAVSTATAALREYLAFKLGAEEYGIDILRVQEIRSYEEPTRLANAPAFGPLPAPAPPAMPRAASWRATWVAS